MTSTMPNKPAVEPTSSFIAALIGPPVTFEMPQRPAHEISAAFEAAKEAYRLAESRHGVASGMRLIAFITKNPSERVLHDASCDAFGRFERAAHLFIMTPVPVGDPKFMECAAYWKRLAYKRFTISRPAGVEGGSL